MKDGGEKIDLSSQQIYIGGRNVLMVTPKGKILVWGENRQGELGLGDKEIHTAPTEMPDSNKFVKIIPQKSSRLPNTALDKNGNVYMWGSNLEGQFGTKNNQQDKNTPFQIQTEQTFTDVISGESSTFAIDTKGELWAWGSNEYSKLGIGKFDQYSQPVKVPGEHKFVNIDAAFQTTLAFDENGDLWGVGNEPGTGNVKKLPFP